MPEKKRTAAEMADWYRNVHREALLRNSKDELDAVIHPGAGRLLNRFVDYAHQLGMRKALAYLEAQVGTLSGRQVLDLGCGRGRWVRQYAARGAQLTGVDISPEAIEVLSREMPQHRFLCQDLTRLSVTPDSFDVVNSVTVLQHLPEDQQERVLLLIQQALKPGGHFVLLENLVDHAPHVFPHRLPEWIRMVEASGLRAVWSSGSNYELLLRAFNRVAGSFSKQGAASEAPVSRAASAGRPSLKHRVGLLVRAALAILSCPLEWVLYKVPLAKPTHGVMIFRK